MTYLDMTGYVTLDDPGVVAEVECNLSEHTLHV